MLLNTSSETPKTLFGRDRVIPRPITPVFLNKTRSPTKLGADIRSPGLTKSFPKEAVSSGLLVATSKLSRVKWRKINTRPSAIGGALI